MKIR